MRRTSRTLSEVLNARGSSSCRKATSRACRFMRQRSAIETPMSACARSYSRTRVRSETVRSSVDSVSGTPAASRAGSGNDDRVREDRGLDIARRAHVEGDVARRQLGHQRSVVGSARAVGDAGRRDRVERPRGPGRRRPTRRRGSLCRARRRARSRMHARARADPGTPLPAPQGRSPSGLGRERRTRRAP